jgi:hypothetical protein
MEFNGMENDPWSPKRSVLLKRWQRDILHKQLKMLNDVFDMMVPFIDSFFPPMLAEIEMWRNNFMESFEDSYLQSETTAVRPATYFAIAWHVGRQLQKHIKVNGEFVFNTECLRDFDTPSNTPGKMLDVFQILDDNRSIGHQIVFLHMITVLTCPIQRWLLSGTTVFISQTQVLLVR